MVTDHQPIGPEAKLYCVCLSPVTQQYPSGRACFSFTLSCSWCLSRYCIPDGPNNIGAWWSIDDSILQCGQVTNFSKQASQSKHFPKQALLKASTSQAAPNASTSQSKHFSKQALPKQLQTQALPTQALTKASTYQLLQASTYQALTNFSICIAGRGHGASSTRCGHAALR